MNVRWLGGAAVLLILLSVLGWHAATRSVDFPIYHQVALQLFDGNYEIYPAEVYADDPPAGRPLAADPHGFRYAPVAAFLFLPFGLLPLEAAAFLFFCLKIAAFVFMIGVVARRMAFPRPGVLMLLTALVAAGYLAEEARNGNFHLFMVFLMVLAFDQAARGRVALPAVSLAIAIAAKLLPLVLLGYFALRRRVALCLATTAALALLWAAPAIVVGVETNHRLFQRFVRYTLQKADEQGNHSLKGALQRHLMPHPPDDARYDTSLAALPEPVVFGLWLMLGVAGAAVLAAGLWRTPRDEVDGMVDLSLVLMAMLVGSPHTQRLHFAAIVVPVAVLMVMLAKDAGADVPARQVSIRDRPDAPARYGTAASGWLVRLALLAVFAAGTLVPALLFTRSAALVYEALSPHFWAALLVGVTLLVLRCARIR